MGSGTDVDEFLVTTHTANLPGIIFYSIYMVFILVSGSVRLTFMPLIPIFSISAAGLRIVHCRGPPGALWPL